MSGRGIVVFSGGSAANNLVDVFDAVARDKNCCLSYVIPISDNGGSTSELIRFIGGPGIGDVRSRLVRLIPEDPNSPSKSALKSLFNHRLFSDPASAQQEWVSLVDGTHKLWTSIPSPTHQLIRSFLLHVSIEITKRSRPPHNTFNFQTASVGNLFLTGARLFTGSFESAIFLLGSLTGVDEDKTRVIPAINSNFSHHICAGLKDGRKIIGQNSISHPSPHTSHDVDPVSPLEEIAGLGASLDGQLDGNIHAHENGDPESEDANPPSSHPSLRTPNIVFQKSPDDGTPPLPSPISRIWYVSPYGKEIHPRTNPRVLSALSNSDTVIYSIGSLYTSILPCLILRDVGASISSPSIKNRILILNGSLDRETGLGIPGEEYTALDFIRAIVEACTGGTDEGEWARYVTHVIYLAGEGTPKVDEEKLREKGIIAVQVYGQKVEGVGMVYDGKGLSQALDMMIGAKKGVFGKLGERSRRNTSER